MFGTIIVGVILFAFAAAAVCSIVRQKKRGGCAGCDGCGGNCRRQKNEK